MEKILVRKVKKRRWKHAKLVPIPPAQVLTQKQLIKFEAKARELHPDDYRTLERLLNTQRTIRLHRKHHNNRLRAETRREGTAMSREQVAALTKQRHAVRRELEVEVRDMLRAAHPRSYDAKIKFYLEVVDYLQSGAFRDEIEWIHQAQLLSTKYMDMVRELMDKRVRMFFRLAKEES